MTHELASQRLDDTLIALASSAPVPGGGGASALAAAVGAALGEMVCSLTSGKARYADVQDRVEAAADGLSRLRLELLALADADAAAFEPLSRAYGLPRSTEEERARKAEVMEETLRVASEPPMRIMAAIREAIDLVDEVSQIGSRIAISDAGAGAAILSAALRAASLNVLINARSMADRAYADDLVARARALVSEGCAVADAAFERVEGMVA